MTLWRRSLETAVSQPRREPSEGPSLRTPWSLTSRLQTLRKQISDVHVTLSVAFVRAALGNKCEMDSMSLFYTFIKIHFYVVYIVAATVPALTTGSSFRLVPLFLWPVPHFWYLSTSLLVLSRWSRLVMCFPYPCPSIRRFSKECRFLLFSKGI